MYISKRAGMEEAYMDYVKTIWKFDRGFFENAFRLVPYAAVPFLGTFGSIVGAIIIQVAEHLLNISPEMLGRELDKALNMSPGDDPRFETSEQEVASLIDKMLANKTASYKPIEISKTAGIVSAVVRGGKAGAWIAKAMFKLISVLASMFVFSHLSEFYNKHVDKPLKEVTAPVREEVYDLTGLNTNVESPKQENNKPEDMATYIEEKYGLT